MIVWHVPWFWPHKSKLLKEDENSHVGKKLRVWKLLSTEEQSKWTQLISRVHTFGVIKEAQKL